jgi:argininosuccinate lyase
MDHSNSLTYNLWGGRFSQDNDGLMKLFNKSILIDKRLWKQDIKCSKEWSSSIAKNGLLTKQEVDLIHKGLTQIYDEWSNDQFEIRINDEDIHTANERRLKEIIGDVAMKLHTGRSRNDQVATDMKLWLIDNMFELKMALLNLIQCAIIRANKEIDILMPGYTHLQRAQPIRWSHLLLSYVTALDRDYERLEQFELRTNVCPLGSGAIAGNPFNINRAQLATNIGFNRETLNSIDSIQSRDFICIYI